MKNLIYLRDKKYEIYWLKAIMTFIEEVDQISDVKLRTEILHEISRQLQFQSAYQLETQYLRSPYFKGKENKRALTYQILHLSKSQRIDVFRNVLNFLPYDSHLLSGTRSFYDAYTVAKNYARRRIDKYYRVIYYNINRGFFATAISLSVRCLREQYYSLGTMNYTLKLNLYTMQFEDAVNESVSKVNRFLSMKESTWFNKYYQLIIRSTYKIFQYEYKLSNKSLIANKSMANYAYKQMRKINEMIYNLKYCK